MFKRSKGSQKLLRKHLWIPALLIAVALSVNSLAQSQSQLQYTRNTMELNRRSIIEVDPVTFGLNLTIPLEEYAGRGVGLPASFHYSSKLWRVEYLACEVPNNPNPVTGIQYAENSESGWTSTLDVPYVEQIGDVEPYIVRFTNGARDSTSDEGKPWDSNCPPQPICPVPGEQNCYAYPAQYYVRRARLHLPDGSSHELRKGDSAVLNIFSLTGLYTAVDESGISYDDTTQTVFMPDGSRYLLNVQEAGTTVGSKYVDRNGNTLFFSNSSQQWTDTLGRSFSNPLAVSQWTVGNAAGGNSTYTFRWRYLRDDQTGETVLTNPNNPADPNPWNPGLSTNPLKTAAPYWYSSGIQPIGPSLFSIFDSIYLTQGSTSRFNPYVLHEIELPNGQKYRFTYNVFGEIDKVLLPTGGYKRYRYDWLPNHAYEWLTTYNQVNRGVVEAWESPSGSGTDENHWQFSTPSAGSSLQRQVTAPDGSYSIRTLQTTSILSSQVFGFDQFTGDVIDGRITSEADYTAGGQLLRGHGYNWAFTGGPSPTFVAYGAPFPIQQSSRAPQLTRQVEILYDTTSGNPLTAVTEMDYDADLNVIRTRRYSYVTITQGQAIPNGTLLRTDETTYLVNDPDIPQTTRDVYRAKGFIRLPSKQQVKDGAGTVVAATQFRYDENTLTTYAAVSGWTDPVSAYRGNVTTVRRWQDYNYATETSQAWVDWSSGTWIQTNLWYDQCGSVVKTRDANNAETTFSYEDNFNTVPAASTFAFPTSITTPIPDSLGTTGSASAFTTTTKYDYNTGLVGEVSDPNLAKTSHQYDALNRLKKRIRADQSQTVISYDDTNRWIITLTDLVTAGESDSGGGLRSVVFFDGLGRSLRSATDEGSNDWTVVETIYDSLSRVSQTSNPFRITASNVAGIPGAAADPNVTKLWTTTEYDALGRVKKLTTPDGAHVDTGYDGNKVTVTDQALKKRQSTSDALGRLMEVVEDPGTGGLAYTTGYAYDALGNLLTVTQDAQTRQFVYDSLSRLAKATNPENGTIKYEYDANGNLTKKTDTRPIRTTYGYDTLNRMTLRSYSDATPAVSYKYDGVGITGAVPNGKGRLASMSSTVSTYSYGEYDALGRVKTASETIYGQSSNQSYPLGYTYDLAGHVKTMTYPSGNKVSYSYDGAGRTNSFTGNLSGGPERNYSSGISYSPFGGLTQEQLSTTTPIFNQLAYNTRGQLAEILVGSGISGNASWDRGKIVNWYSPSCAGAGCNTTDNNGNLMRQDHSIQDGNGNVTANFTQKYEYDNLNRLQRVYDGNPNAPVWQQRYSYDRWGNRTIAQNDNTGMPTWSFGVDPSTNRLTAPGGWTMGYDAAGNLTYDSYTGQGERRYDAENRITQAQGGGNSSWQYYTYDGDGHRVKRTVSTSGGSTETWQVYGVGGELLAEYAANANPTTTSPQKEYGYRHGQLLVTTESATASAPPPAGLSAIPSGNNPTPTVTLGWSPAAGATNYRVERATRKDGPYELVAHTSSTSLIDNSVNNGTAYLYKVCSANNQNNCTSGYSNIALGAAIIFATDPTIKGFSEDPANATTPKAAHITELRTAVNAVRILAGRSVIAVPNPATGDPIGVNNVRDLRAKLAEALTDLGITLPTYTDATLKGFSEDPLNATPIKAAHIRELRQAATNGIGGSGGGGGSSFQIHWLVSDQLGTPRMIFDQSGSLSVVDQNGNYVSGMTRHDYLPFGEELFAGTGGRTTAQGYTGDSVRQKFTGQQRDNETGLDYFLARYYSSTQGRFTGVDPENAGADPSHPQSWNSYAYAWNRPTVFVDPDGQTIKICDNEGRCSEISDADANKYTFNKDYAKANGFSVKGNNIFDPEGNKVGSWVRTSFDDLTPTANALIFGDRTSPGLSQMAAPMEKGILIVGAINLAPAVVIVGADVLAGGGGLTLLKLGTRAAPALPAVPSALDKLSKIGLSVDQANAIIQSPASQKLIDNANNGNINVIQEIGGKLIRITTDPSGQRIISAGIVRANSITNGIANGRFTPKK